MNYYTIIPLSGLLVNIFLLAYIMGSVWENRATRAFKLLCCAFIIWEIMDIIHWSGVSDQTAYYAFKILSPFSFVSPLLILNFFYALTGRRRGYFFYFTAACVFVTTLLLFFTDLHMKEAILHTYWGVLPTPGPLYVPDILAVYMLPLCYIVFLTIAAIIKSRDIILKKTLAFVLSGVVSMWMLGFCSVVILPVFFHIYDYPRLGSTAGALISFFIFIPLVRFKFLAMSDNKITYDLLSRITDGVILCDTRGVVVEINVIAAAILELDAPSVKGTDIRKYLPAPYDFIAEYKDFELPIEPAGNEKFILLSQRIITMANFPIGKMIILKDITGRKRDEERIRKSAAEKEVLLREMQHRIKNNLNILYSLINFGAEQLSRDADREIFISALSRIQSMGIVYEQLYSSEEIDQIRLDNYIDRLARDLIEINSMNSTKIQISTALEPIILDSKRAVILGLILNELIMNSIKHAFPEAGTGLIEIILSLSGGWIILEVRDNGVGTPADKIEPGTGTYGMKLVTLLVQQISGLISIESSGGQKVCVRIER